jgi:hypothetical protein
MDDPRKRMILDLVVEDEYGLWEVLWRLQSTEPRLSGADAVEAARTAVTELHGQGLVTLEWSRAGMRETIPRHRLRELLLAPSSWEVPQTVGEGVFISATASGEDAYNES